MKTAVAHAKALHMDWKLIRPIKAACRAEVWEQLSWDRETGVDIEWLFSKCRVIISERLRKAGVEIAYDDRGFVTNEWMELSTKILNESVWQILRTLN